MFASRRPCFNAPKPNALRHVGCNRDAFTIVELLIVLAVTGVLLALLLPAVQQARTAARRTHCLNNLRQHGVAIHNHIGALGIFPSGGWGVTWLGMSDRGAGKQQPGGWIYSILPYSEQASVFELGPKWTEASVRPDVVRTLAIQPVPMFFCPERRTSASSEANSNLFYFGLVSLSTCAKSDYAINGGTKFFKSIDGPRGVNPTEVSRFPWPSTSMLDGVCFLRSEVRMSDISDGSSHVIAVGEKWTDGTDFAANGNDQPMFAGDCLDVRRWGLVSPARDRNPLGNETSFGSAHLEGAGFLLSDGSARVIPYYVDPNVFAQLCARNDGNVDGGEY